MQAIGLHQHRGVGSPGDGRAHCGGHGFALIKFQQWRRHRRWRLRRFWQAVPQALVLPAKEICRGLGSTRCVVFLEPLWRVVRLGRV